MNKDMNQQKVVNRVMQERDRQDTLHPKPHDFVDRHRLAILVEEVGEVAKALYESDYDGLESELVQVAAVAVRWLEVLEEERHTIPEVTT